MTLKGKRVLVLGPVIIGAGPSGLAAAACLKENGIPSLVLERENCIGSLWKLKTYDHLNLHLPKKFSELPLLPLPPLCPEYPTKQQFVSYLQAYAKFFSIKPLFGEEVQRSEYDSSIGLWRVLTRKTEYVCRWLIVATGENAEAVLPEIDGLSDFHGLVLHSSSYAKGEEFKGEKVLVVGCGNSGMDICLDLCNSNAQASMVVRDKLHVLPREILGTSTFGLAMWLLKWLPIKVVDAFILFCSWLILGDTGRYGLSRPEIGPLQLKNATGKTPVLHVGTLDEIKRGRIKVVPGIRRFTTKGAEFVNGEAAEFDSVILATGYKSSVTSWLKGVDFFNSGDGFPKKPFPNSWKGNNGLYAVGFTRRGLLGASLDAQRVAQDIAAHWNSKSKRSCL